VSRSSRIKCCDGLSKDKAVHEKKYHKNPKNTAFPLIGVSFFSHLSLLVSLTLQPLRFDNSLVSKVVTTAPQTVRVLFMKRLDRSLQSPPDDLALDEALLDEAESGRGGETLRMWSFDRPVVVIGRGSKITGEVDLAYCQAQGIPVLRRCSGGAAIVGGPGCLMYSVVLSIGSRPELQRVDMAHHWVMSRLVAAIRRQVVDVQWQGTCDLTLHNRKFSGNSLRVARQHILYHGTILHAADLAQIARCLTQPPRQPDYRQSRPHSDFITNLAIDPQQLTHDIAQEFEAVADDVSPQSVTLANDWPRDATAQLVRSRYNDPAWHHRH